MTRNDHWKLDEGLVINSLGLLSSEPPRSLALVFLGFGISPVITSILGNLVYNELGLPFMFQPLRN